MQAVRSGPAKRTAAALAWKKYEVEALDSARRFSCWRMQALTTYDNILEYKELGVQEEGITSNSSFCIKFGKLVTYKDSLGSYQRHSRSVVKTKMFHTRHGKLT
jgi:hypothetical protein